MKSLVLAAGLKAIVTNSPTEVPGVAQVYEVDTAAGTATLVATQKEDFTAVSGATVCDGTYYAVYTNFGTSSFGVVSVPLGSENASMTLLDTPQLYHKLACDPHNPGSLLAVASAPAFDQERKVITAAAGATFALTRYDVKTQQETQVGSFPAKDALWGGQDTVFNFKADGSEVWAAWPRDDCPQCPGAKTGGHLHVLDTQTGQVKTSVPIAADGLLSPKAVPYFVLPDAMRGVFAFGGSDLSKLFWVDLKLDGGKLTYKKQEPAANTWGSSKPNEVCGGSVLVLQQETQGISSSDLLVLKPADGSTVSDFKFATIQTKTKAAPLFAAVACNEAKTRDVLV